MIKLPKLIGVLVVGSFLVGLLAIVILNERRSSEIPFLVLILATVFGGVIPCLIAWIVLRFYLKQTKEELAVAGERMSRILESISDGFFVLNQDMRVTFFNRAAGQLLGRKAEDVVGKRLFDAFPEARGSIFEEKYSQALRDRSQVSFETHFTVDPYENWYDVRVYPFEDGISIFFQVTTDRKKAEKELRDSEERFRLAKAATKLGVHDYDVLSGTINWDDRVRELWGVDSDVQITHEIFESGLCPDDLEVVRAAVARALDPEGNSQYEALYRVLNPKEHVLRWVHATGQVCFDQGRAVRLVGTVEDITERKEAEEALRKAYDELELRVRERTADLERTKEYIATERQRLHDIFETLPSVISLLTTDHRIVFANRAFREKFGEVTGRRCFEACFGFTGPCDFCETYSVLITGKPHRWEHATQDGSSVFDVNAFPFFDVDGSPLILEVSMDITEQRKAQDKIAAERKRLFNILETMPIIVCLLTSDHRIAFANRRFRETFGEDIDRHCFDLIFGSKEPCEFCEAYKALETGVPHRWETTGPDGSIFEVYNSPFTDTDGSQLVLEVDVDITERKEAEKLREQTLLDAEIINKIFSTTHVSIIFLDREFNFIRVNQAYADACGHPPDFFRGKNHFRLYPHEENESIFRHVVETGDTFTAYAKPFEFPDDPDRGVTYWDWTLHPVRDAQGVVEGLIFILLEVTDRKRAEDERAAAERELVRSNQDLQQFAYMASHDLQEPLRTVTGALQLFEKRHRGKFDKESDQLIDFAVDGVKRMKTLIQDLLDYSRLNTRGKPFEVVSIKEVLDQSLLSLKSLIEEKGAEITCDHMPSVLGDPGQLRRLFQNLIGNAVKFSADRAPKVRVSAKRHDAEWVFSVKDNGIGIETEYFERIFVIFQRLSKKGPGTGMGLAIVKRIVERHKGRVWVESQIGQGSTFYFTIPEG